MGSAEPVAPRRRPWRRGIPSIAVAIGVVVAGLLVWAAADATTPGRDRLLISPVAVEVAETAPGTANFALRGLAPGAEGRAVVSVTYAGRVPGEVRLFTVPTSGWPQSLAPFVQLVIDDPTDGAAAWSGTLDEFQSLDSFAEGILPREMSRGDRRDFEFHYSIAEDALPSSQASAVLVWRAERPR